MKFSKKKFDNFSDDKQKKVFLDFIRTIEMNWQNKAKRKELLFAFRECLNFPGKDELTEISGLLSKRIDLRDFLAITVALEQKLGSDLKDDDFLIFQKDEEKPDHKSIPLYLILDNLRSSFNVGSIFRIAECFGIEEILPGGYTATPENKKVQKTAMGTDKIVKWRYFEQTAEAIEFLKEKNIPIFALETTSHAKSIYDIKFPKPVALLFGNEALGISKEILHIVDDIVQIPVSGWKNSLNVGVTAGICCYEVSRQWKTINRKDAKGAKMIQKI